MIFKEEDQDGRERVTEDEERVSIQDVRFLFRMNSVVDLPR